jgi:hypothetical protein
MLPDQTILRFTTMFLWVSISVGLWIGGPKTANKILGFTPDMLIYVLLAPVVALVIALLACLLVGLGMAYNGKQSASAYEQAGRVAKLYSSVTDNVKPAAVEYDLFYEPSPTKPSEIYREYDDMRAALASHVRGGDDAMPKEQQVKRYVELGGVPKDYFYRTPRQLRKLKKQQLT